MDKTQPGVRPTGHLFCLAGAILWGTTGTTQALAPVGASPEVIGALRQIIGGAGLLAIGLARSGLGRPKDWPPLTTLLAAACMAGYQLCFFYGVSRTGVAVGTIVGIGSSPIWGGFLGFFVARRTAGETLGRGNGSGDLRLHFSGGSQRENDRGPFGNRPGA